MGKACTQLAVVGAFVSCARRRCGKRRARRLQSFAAAELAILALGPAIAALVLLRVAVPVVLWRRGQGIGGGAAWLQIHAIDARRSALQVEVAQLGLEVVDVAAAVFDLAVEAREDGRVVGRLAHGIGGVDQGLFTVDFALHIGNRLLDVGHGEGVVWRRVRRRRRVGGISSPMEATACSGAWPSLGWLGGRGAPALIQTDTGGCKQADGQAGSLWASRSRCNASWSERWGARPGEESGGEAWGQWRRYGAAVVMSSGRQRFSSRIRRLSGAPLCSPLSALSALECSRWRCNGRRL